MPGKPRRGTGRGSASAQGVGRRAGSGAQGKSLPEEAGRREGSPATREGKAEKGGRRQAAGRGGRRAGGRDADERRRAILAAALEVFSQRGFATARLDDVAARAGIAKGTLYLYFKSKEALFEELIRSYVSPLLANLEQVAGAVPPDVLIARFYELFRTQVLGTKRQQILQLLISEGAHFPAVADFYYREIVSRGLRLIRRALEDAPESAMPAATLQRYPQLIAAPLILCVVWDRLFGRLDPLDVEGLLAAQAQILSNAGRGGS